MPPWHIIAMFTRSLWLLLFVAFQVYRCTSYPLPSISVVYPENHSSWLVDPHTGAIKELVVAVALQNFRVPYDGVIRVTGEKIGRYSDGVVHTLDTPWIRLQRVELGSHFWTFTLVHTNGSVVAQSCLHVETVLPQDTALPRWHYTPSKKEMHPTILFNLPQTTPDRQRHKLCFIGMSSGLFDGQKKMWLQVIEELPKNTWDVHFVAFESLVESSVFVNRLRPLDVSIHGVPLVIQRDELEELALSPSQAIPTVIQSFHKIFQQDNVSIHRFRERVGELFPLFAGRVWETIVNALHDNCHNGVLIMANSRDIADQLLTTAARIAGVRAVVMELANLKPVRLQVDALVAPSHYALHHPTVTEPVTARQRYVLNTGVNTTLFRPEETSKRSPTFVVGYVGRLSTDKSVGLVLGVARLLAKSCPYRCKVRVIGDGPLRSELQALAQEWRLGDIVHFTGGIYTESLLVGELQHMDAVISPCFHETFGIAPLEAMSCGIPVVSFATGGVLEYLQHNENGLVVQEPTVEGLYNAIANLRDDHVLRRRLGKQARRTVIKRFAHDLGIHQFVTLYERLAQGTMH